MKSTTRFASCWMFFAIVAVLAGWLSAFPTLANAQGSQGQNAVYSSNGIVGSYAFIDASTFAASPPPPNRNFCGVLNFVLQIVDQPPIYPSGAVIDARGLNSTNTSMTCTASPWGSGSSYLNVPSTILLPATGGTTSPKPIIIPGTWILPPNTRLIGEGDGIPSGSSTPGTTIQAKANSFSGSMIQFGPSVTFCVPPGGGGSICTGISVENLSLDGQGQAITGIINQFSGDQSYVDHVSLYQIRGTGLSISAFDSGPYSNITFDTGNYAGASSTVCVQIFDAGRTRGIHGLSCNAGSVDAFAAVLLDSSNNSIEDVRIVGFYDGIRVGKNGVAQSNAAGGQTC